MDPCYAHMLGHVLACNWDTVTPSECIVACMGLVYRLMPRLADIRQPVLRAAVFAGRYLGNNSF
jgi:hypothetical protein